MEVRFEDSTLERLATDASFTANLGHELVKKFRKRLQFIRAATDERDFYAMKSLHYEKLQGDREGQRSMRLNNQWRLILRIESDASGKLVVVISITDYH